MSGHGPFVWSAYAVFLFVVIALIWLPQRRHRRTLKALAQRERLAQKRSSTALPSENTGAATE